MTKQLKFDGDARSSILKGVETLTMAVAATLGPKGRNVIISKAFGSPVITKDGVTVAREIVLEDPWENMGAQLVREVASKTSDIAGDGTTTATVLANAIYKEGLKNVTAGSNPMDLKRGIEKAVIKIVKEIASVAKPIADKSEIAQIATISANNDPEIGALISDAMDKVGKDGVITVEEAKSLSTDLTIVEGMQFDRGYISPYFVTNPDQMECVLEEPVILNYDKKLSSLSELIPLLEEVIKLKKPLLVIAEDLGGEVLSGLVVNKARGVINVCAVKAPGFGDRRKDMLEDISIITGGVPISEETGIDVSNVLLSQLGTAKKVIIDKDSTTIVEGNGNPETIKARVSQIKHQISVSDNDYDKEKLQERLAKIVGGVAVINIGAATEVEMKEKKARVEDALHATRAAVDEGIVPGGGVALLNTIKVLDTIEVDNNDQRIGIEIIKKAIQEPTKQIVTNAGMVGEMVVQKILESDDNVGFNTLTDEYVNMIDAGVIDPAKVTRSALQNASSVAALMLTTAVMITDSPADDNAPAGMPPQQGMPMY